MQGQQNETSLLVSTTHEVGEFVELNVAEDVQNSPLYNQDIAPTKITQRTWHKGNVAALWVGMSICVPTHRYSRPHWRAGMPDKWTPA